MPEVKHDRASDYHSMIRLAVTTEKYARAVTGTLFGDKHPRIIDIKGIEIEASSPRTCSTSPTTTSRASSVASAPSLGESKVNIATLGRDAPGGSAIALVQFDQPISPELWARSAALEGVVQAKLLSF